MRRIVKIIAVLVVLAAGVVVAGTLVLRSDWLGRRILAQASDRLGMDIRAESFSLGWSGKAAVGGLRVQMPMSEAVVLSADRVQLDVGALPLLLLRRQVQVRSVSVDHPTVFLRQSDDGRWNAQEVWARVQAALGSGAERGSTTRLPEVVVRAAALEIADAGGTTQTVSPVEFEGHGQGQVLWRFDLQAPPVAEVTGQVVEGGDWAHEARFHVQKIGPLVSRLTGRSLSEIRLAGRWRGAVAGGAVRGAIQFDEFVADPVALQGGAQIHLTPEGVTIGPRGLIVSEPNFAGQAIQLTDGTVELSRAQIVAASLAARAGVLGGRVDGRWNLGARRGEFSGSWAAAGPDPSAQYDGTYRLSVAAPREGRREVGASVTVQARTPVGSWQAAADAQAGGADWRILRWQIKVPALSWARGERRVNVTDLAARIDLHWPEIRLTSLSIPAARQVDAEAQFAADTRRWSARIAIEQLHPPSWAATGMDFRLSAEGDDRRAHVSELHAALDGNTITAKGDLSLVGWDLRNAHVSADWSAHAPAAPGTKPPAGRWRLEAGVAGQVRPIALEAEATLSGQDIAVGKRRIERVQIPVHVRADAARIEATTQPFDLLGGQWQSTGHYEFSGRATEVYVMATDLSLGAVASMAGLPLASQGRARAAIALHMPGLELQKAVATGSWSARDVQIPPVVARRAQGRLRVADGLVRLDKIQLEQDSGRARAEASFRLDEPQVVSVGLDAQDWPLPLEGRPVTVVMNGRTSLRTNVVKKTAEGDARGTCKVVWQEKNLADIQVAARVQGQTLDVHELQARTLGGSVDGTAVIALNRWVDSVAQLRWQGVEPKQLAAWLPALARFEGTMSGSLAIEQTRRPEAGEPAAEPLSVVPLASSEIRPLAPLRFALDANVPGGRFGSARIDRCRVTGYLDSQRLLLDSAHFDVLEGRLDARARLSRRTGTYYGAISADFNDLSLDQLVHALNPEAGAQPGRLGGSVTVLPALDRKVMLSGGGRIRLSQSDLANNVIVRSLYNTLSLNFGSQKPAGTGEVEVQLQGPAVVLSSVQYFNRGVEIRGAGRIVNVNLGADSPIEGYAVASTRILKGIKVPGLRTFDHLLDAVQTSAGSVKIAGTIDEVRVQVVPLPEILDPFRRLLWAQLRE